LVLHQIAHHCNWFEWVKKIKNIKKTSDIFSCTDGIKLFRSLHQLFIEDVEQALLLPFFLSTLLGQ